MIYISWSLLPRTTYKRCPKAWVGESENHDSELSSKWSGRFRENEDTWLFFERQEASTSNIHIERLFLKKKKYRGKIKLSYYHLINP